MFEVRGQPLPIGGSSRDVDEGATPHGRTSEPADLHRTRESRLQAQERQVGARR